MEKMGALRFPWVTQNNGFNSTSAAAKRVTFNHVSQNNNYTLLSLYCDIYTSYVCWY